jgi:phage gp46-like protein
MAEQQGDVKLFQTNDNGDINVEGGVTEMSPGLDTAAYLSLFGGNYLDDGRADNPLTYWANTMETDPARQYRSQTQYALAYFSAIPFNLGRIEDAANADLAWMITEGVASSITVSASIPGLNRIQLAISIEAQGEESSFKFTENWKASV